MNRIAALAYGSACYAIFLGVFLYAAGFMLNLGVPNTIDSGLPESPGWGIVVNIALLGVFALQHSVMARIGFKRRWARIIPQPIERATYVLASCGAMILIFWGWQPLPQSVFAIDSAAGRALIHGVFGLGVALILYATFLIDHLDLFGLRQVLLYFRGRPYTEKRFITPALYKHIRHPLYVGWFIFFWATPDMTLGHLLMAGVTTAYILVAIVFEERDLSTLLGSEYRAYRERTPMFLPRLRGEDETRPTSPVAA